MGFYKAKLLTLHLGLAKTGSSALQNVLFRHRQKLIENYSILYLGIGENHCHIQSVFSQFPESLPQIKRLDFVDRHSLKVFLEQTRQDILDEIHYFKPNHIIVSSEYFSSMSLPELRSLWEFLNSVAEKIEPLAYVRDPWSFAPSFVQELIRSELLDGEIEFGYLESNVEILSKFEEAFQCPLNVIPYCAGSGYDVIEDFLCRLGIEAIKDDEDRFISKNLNKSMSREAAIIALRLNKILPTMSPSKDWVMEALQEVSENTSPIRISRKSADEIYSKSKSDVELLEQKYFGGDRIFSNLYSSTVFDDFDDRLSLACLTVDHAVDFLLAACHKLASKALHYHNQFKINSADRLYWKGKYCLKIGDFAEARRCFGEAFEYVEGHQECLLEIDKLNNEML